MAKKREKSRMSGSGVVPSGITYFGGKFNALPLILSYFPRKRSKTVFVELFAGSCAISVNYACNLTIINDIDEYLTNFLWVMQGSRFRHKPDNPEWRERLELYQDFETEIQTVARAPFFEEKYRDREDPVGKAVYFLLLSKNNFSGIIHKGRPNPFDYKLPGNVQIRNYEALLDFFDKCDVRIWNLDFREVLTRANNNWHETERQNFFIYCDPPYPKQGYGYDHKFTDKDLKDLSGLLHECEHHWILSEEDCDLVRDHFEDCHIKPVEWQYSCTKERTTLRRGELLISNRPFKKSAKGNLGGLGRFRR